MVVAIRTSAGLSLGGARDFMEPGISGAVEAVVRHQGTAAALPRCGTWDGSRLER